MTTRQANTVPKNTPSVRRPNHKGDRAPVDTASRSPKAKKPYRSFPLTPHRNGQFCKKIRGKVYYFGSVADPDRALANYHQHCDGLHSGAIAQVSRGTGPITLRELANEFLNAAATRRDGGRLTDRTFADYHRTCAAVIAALGRDLPVESIGRKHLVELHRRLAKGVSAVTLDGRIGIARSLFKFAYDEELVERPLRLKSLPRPEKRVLRRDRAQRGRRHFLAGEIRTLVRAARTPLRAMILLGINCGLGNTDIGRLTVQAVDLERGWLDFPRPKTGVDRRCPLWPETVEAICEVMDQRTNRKCPVKEEAKDLLFVTRQGRAFVRTVPKFEANGRPTPTEHDAIATAFKRLMADQGITIPRLGFYGLRRSFETFGGETGQQVAVDHIMGHVPPSNDMGAVYRQHVAEAALRVVTDHIRQLIFSLRPKDGAGV
jgi:integrase